MNVDLLGLTRYVGQKIIENHVRFDDQFEARERSIVDRMKTVASIQDFYKIALDTHQLAIDLNDREISSRMKSLECERNLTCGTTIRDEWGNVSYDRSQYYWTQLELRRNLQTRSIALGSTIQFDGSTITVVANNQNFLLAGDSSFASYDQSVVTFASGAVSVTASGFLGVKMTKLDTLHTDLVREFSSVEHDDSVKHERLQKAGRAILSSFKKVMAGERPPMIDNPFDITK